MAFGIGTDLFAKQVAGTGLQSQSRAPSGIRADHRDKDGNITESTVKAGVETVTSGPLEVRAGVTVANPIFGGAYGDYTLIGFRMNRSNTARLTVEYEGVLTTLMRATHPTFTPDLSSVLTGGKGAIALGVTVSAGEIQSLSVDARCDFLEPFRDKDGVLVATSGEAYGLQVTATNEVQTATGTPTATVASGWTLAPESGAESENNQDYGSKTFVAFRNYVPDVAP